MPSKKSIKLSKERKWREVYGKYLAEHPENIYERARKCPEGGKHEYAYQLSLGHRNNHGECWKCGDSPGLAAYNEQCDENIRNNECGICGGPRGHYGECK